MAPIIRASETRRLAGLGRVRAVLRLGERADARPPRRAVLAARRRAAPAGRCSSSAAAPAASRCRSRAPASTLVGIDRSAPMLERARRAQLAESRNAPAPPSPLRLVRGDIRALPFRRRRVRDGAGAVRHPAVADRATRDLAATLDVGRARARAAAARSASISCPTCRTGASTRTASSCAAARRRRAPHAGRIGAPGSDAASDDLRAALRRAARRPTRASTGSTLTFRTLSVRQMTRRLERAGFRVDAVLGDYRGRPWDDARRRLDHPARKSSVSISSRPVIFVDFSGSFRHVRPFQVGIDQAQEGRRSTPSAARSSRASSRN